MPTCPNGHQSAADEWCDVCGHPMTATPAAVPPPPASPPPGPPPAPGQGTGGYGYGYPTAPPPPGGPTGGYGYPAAHGAPGQGVPPGQPTHHTELCPRCRTPRESRGPFCEECRYNFHSHAAAYAPPAPPPGFHQPGPPPVYEDSRPSRMNRPAEPIPPQPETEHGDWNLAPPAAPPAPPQQPQPYEPYPPQHHPPHPTPSHQQPHHQSHQQPHQQTPPPHQQAPAPGYPGGPSGPQSQGAGWVVTIGPDREYFTAMMQRSGPEGAGLSLPAYSPEQHVTLSGQQVSIGRRRNSTGEAPDIDLSRPPEDPGVSHQHALLVQQPDGAWAVVDQDSTNGTTLNGAEDPIQPFVPVPLAEGDRVHVGAWTTLTLRRG
ncbi:FHA domain-containing protein [Streptomyces sp. TRM 70351]|uniref:FHA domain-containing protein n=1 Tax=Streptomyces sp. TRM 70351 TaxID=3116552 RepID=UPI002E7AB902|nr:FHA domain-containing protein [Streptomyces sp. TRM 70351]MEE1928351.1 FHA domain-containing protein [Streptomyces sp. TRM 70351]